MLLLLLLIPPVGDTLSLRWQFKEGDSFLAETKSHLVQTVNVNGKAYPQDTVHTSVVKYTVTAIDKDGRIVLEQQIESMKASNPDGSPSVGNNAILNQLQGAIIKARLSPQYEVKELEGYDELIKRLAGDDPSVRRVVQALLSEDQLKQTIQNTLGMVPQKDVEAGATWKRQLLMQLGPLGSIKTELDFKVSGATKFEDKDLIKIDYQPSIQYIPPTGDATNPVLSITQGKVQLKSGSGTIYFDAKAGRLYSSSLKLQLTGELTARVNGTEMLVTFDQTQTIDVRIKK